jgi:hypothetical protein
MGQASLIEDTQRAPSAEMGFVDLRHDLTQAQVYIEELQSARQALLATPHDASLHQKLAEAHALVAEELGCAPPAILRTQKSSGTPSWVLPLGYGNLRQPISLPVTNDPVLGIFVAPPSGKPALDVLTMCWGGSKTGKLTLVNGGGEIVGKDGQSPRSTRHTMQSFGFATLEDVAHWCRLAASTGGYIVRARLKPEYQPAVMGVRRAAAENPNLGKLPLAFWPSSPNQSAKTFPGAQRKRWPPSRLGSTGAMDTFLGALGAI